MIRIVETRGLGQGSFLERMGTHGAAREEQEWRARH
jgi:hypothetical protein